MHSSKSVNSEMSFKVSPAHGNVKNLFLWLHMSAVVLEFHISSCSIPRHFEGDNKNYDDFVILSIKLVQQ
jgi:hypothetical protein